MNPQWTGWDADETKLRSVKGACMALTLVNMALSLGCGMIPTGVTRHNWVSFAATLALVALMAQVIAAVRFGLAKPMLDPRSFSSIHQMMRWPAQCHILLMTIAFIAGCHSCVTAFAGLTDILVMLSFLLSAGGSFALMKIYGSVRVCEVDVPQ